jgi:hypothetical protein
LGNIKFYFKENVAEIWCICRSQLFLVCPYCCLMKRGKQCLFMCVRKGVLWCVYMCVSLCMWLCVIIFVCVYLSALCLRVCFFSTCVNADSICMIVCFLSICVCMFLLYECVYVCTSMSECGFYMQGSVLSAFS